jgi:hypothetical protein
MIDATFAAVLFLLVAAALEALLVVVELFDEPLFDEALLAKGLFVLL